MKNKIILWLFCLFLFASFAYTANLNCSITLNESCVNTKVLYLQNDSGGYNNAHAQNVSQGNYSYVVCCDANAISDNVTASCEDTTFLKLSSTSNAHVQQPSIGTYLVDACISVSNGKISCQYLTNCTETQSCLVSMASSSGANTTNSHVGPCAEYSTKVCCGTSSPPTHSVPILNATDHPLNRTRANITCYNQTTSEPDNANLTNVYNWYKNNKSIMLLNLPFDINDSATAKDYSGYGNNGTFGADNTSYYPIWNTSGKKGGAYNFGCSGTNQSYLQINNSESLNGLSTISIEFWMFKTGANSDIAGIVAKYNTSYATSEQGAAFYFSQGTNPLTWGVNTGSLTSITFSGTNDNVWYHVVGTYDGSQIKLYVNGSEKNSTSLTGAIINSFAPLYIGRLVHSDQVNYGNCNHNGIRGFVGLIDEIRIYNFSLSAEQVNQRWLETKDDYFNSETITSQETTKGDVWKCEITPTDGMYNGASLNSTPLTILNSPPSAPSINLTPDNTHNQDIYCNITSNSSDDDLDSIQYSYLWYKNSVLNRTVGYTSVPYDMLASGNLSIGDSWNCTVIPYDGFLNGTAGSDNISIRNSVPGNVSLSYPLQNDSFFINRTPRFNWTNATDPNSDTLTYHIEVSLNSSMSAPRINQTGISADFFEAPYELEFTTYFWHVRANDSTSSGEWSETWNFTLIKYMSASLINANINFATLSINTEQNTSDDDPLAFALQNDGNSEINVTIKSSRIWMSTLAPLNTTYFMFKANYSNESNSFNYTDSQTNWTNMSDEEKPIISTLNHTDANDLGYIDISVRVPSDETPSSKSANVTFTLRQL